VILTQKSTTYALDVPKCVCFRIEMIQLMIKNCLYKKLLMTAKEVNPVKTLKACGNGLYYDIRVFPRYCPIPHLNILPTMVHTC